jgi:hypothetical protein
MGFFFVIVLAALILNRMFTAYSGTLTHGKVD